MLFHTQQFLFFFAVVFALYWAMPWPRARVWLLVVASFYFYVSWNAWLAALIGASAIVDYVLGRLIEGAAEPRRKLLLVFSITWNLGQLAYFKYANFFLDSLAQLLSAAGLHPSLPTLSIILPIGISFYTFEAISYTVDVYRGRIPAERNLINFVLFITFFPRLIAGPIIRGRQFLPQVRREKHWDWARLQLGANFFLLGLIKKLVIADRLAVFVDPVYANPAAYSSAAAWVAVFAYAIQIYCDFSGYSDMAVGLGHALGYKLPQNFRMPYFAPNIIELWGRWHISLTSWLRDYLFIPLKGWRPTRARLIWGVLITMTLCGLWHGARWTFVMFGLIHGCLLIGHHTFKNFARRHPWLGDSLASSPGTILRVCMTFCAFALTGVLFRAGNFPIAQTVFGRLLAFSPGEFFPQSMSIFWSLMAIVFLAHLFMRFGLWEELWSRAPAYARGFAYASALSLCLMLSPDAGKAFIYFQF